MKGSGRFAFGLLLLTAGLVGVLAVFAVSTRATGADLRSRLSAMEQSLAGLRARQQALVEESSRLRLELTEAKEKGDGATKKAAELAERLATAEAALAAARRERDDHLSARLTLERRLEDVLAGTAGR